MWASQQCRIPCDCRGREGTGMNEVMKGTAYDYQYKQAKEIKESMCFTSFSLSCMGGSSVEENIDSS